MTIETAEQLDDICLALSNWFKSQDIEPAEAVLVCEFFISRMIVENSHTTSKVEKLCDVFTHLTELTNLIESQTL